MLIPSIISSKPLHKKYSPGSLTFQIIFAFSAFFACGYSVYFVKLYYQSVICREIKMLEQFRVRVIATRISPKIRLFHQNRMSKETLRSVLQKYLWRQVMPQSRLFPICPAPEMAHTVVYSVCFICTVATPFLVWCRSLTFLFLPQFILGTQVYSLVPLELLHGWWLVTLGLL